MSLRMKEQPDIWWTKADTRLQVDLDTFSTYIVQGTPAWNSTQESAYQKVMDEFQQYSNTAGFFIGMFWSS